MINLIEEKKKKNLYFVNLFDWKSIDLEFIEITNIFKNFKLECLQLLNKLKV